jgi:hypothetical protein
MGDYYDQFVFEGEDEKYQDNDDYYGEENVEDYDDEFNFEDEHDYNIDEDQPFVVAFAHREQLALDTLSDLDDINRRRYIVFEKAFRSELQKYRDQAKDAANPHIATLLKEVKMYMHNNSRNLFTLSPKLLAAAAHYTEFGAKRKNDKINIIETKSKGEKLSIARYIIFIQQILQ